MRARILAVVLLLLGAAAWIALRGRTTDSPETGSEAAPGPDTSVASTSRAERARAAAEEAPTTAASDLGSVAPPQPAPDPAATIAPGVEMQVIDRATGRPVPGIEIFLLVWQSAPAAARESQEDSVTTACRFGKALATDTEGRVVLPRFTGEALVAAQSGDLRGHTHLRGTPRRPQLVLHRPLPVTVLVQDAGGKPCAAVGVLLVERHEQSQIPAADAVMTATDGTARFDDAAEQCSGDVRPRGVTVALPFVDRPSAALEAGSPPTGPVTLVLPPSGRVRCEVVDESGAPVPDGQEVLLRLPATGRILFVEDGPDRWDDARAHVQGGSALFPWVGLGRELEVAVPSSDGSRATSLRRFAGPVAAGEETLVRISLGAQKPVVVGRLIDVKAAPVAGLEVVGKIVEPGHAAEGFHVGAVRGKTDAAGRFRFAFDRASDDAKPATFALGQIVRTPNSWGPHGIAEIALPASLPVGETDVGDVVFKGGGLLLAGVVVDERGAPLEGVTVRAMKAENGGRSPLHDVGAPATDAQGRFRLLGDPSSGRVHVGLDLPGRFAEEGLSFDAGAEDVRIVMPPAGGIAGSVRIPAGIDAFDVRIQVTGDPSENGDGGYRFRIMEEGLRTHADDDGRFEITTLRPGRARIAIRLGLGNGDPILDLDGLEIAPGKVLRDPRLQDVDLVKSKRTIRVTVLDGDREPVHGAVVHFLPKAKGASWEHSTPTGAGGRTSVHAVGDSVRLVVICPGFRSGEVAEATSDTIVELERSPPSTVRVRLAAGTKLPAPPHTISASLRWIPPGGGDPDHRSDPRDVYGGWKRFDSERLVSLEAAGPARYRVELTLWKAEGTGGGRSGSRIDTLPESCVVSVPADGGPVEVTVGIDAEELESRIRRGW